jgi:hypothetical protein
MWSRGAASSPTIPCDALMNPAPGFIIANRSVRRARVAGPAADVDAHHVRLAQQLLKRPLGHGLWDVRNRRWRPDRHRVMIDALDWAPDIRLPLYAARTHLTGTVRRSVVRHEALLVRMEVRVLRRSAVVAAG